MSDNAEYVARLEAVADRLAQAVWDLFHDRPHEAAAAYAAWQEVRGKVDLQRNDGSGASESITSDTSRSDDHELNDGTTSL